MGSRCNPPYPNSCGWAQWIVMIRRPLGVSRNSYDPVTNCIVIDPVRARAFEFCLLHFSNALMNGEKAYAIPSGSVDISEHMRQFAGFIFLTAWAASSNRPNDTITYTHNWPFEPLVGNRPTGESAL